MMHNEEVNLSIEDCRQEMTRLKALIEVVGARECKLNCVKLQ